jgi:hypothetical protein
MDALRLDNLAVMICAITIYRVVQYMVGFVRNWMMKYDKRFSLTHTHNYVLLGQQYGENEDQ